MNEIKCVSCKGELEEGAIGNNGMNWRKGKQHGRKLSEVLTLGTDTVYTYKCKSCGLLQSYTAIDK